MLPSEVFMASRDAHRDMERIDAELRELEDSIGVQGHSYERHSKNGVLDPSRQVIRKIAAEEGLAGEKAECMRSVSEARRLLVGVRALCGHDMADVVELYYVEGMSVGRTASYVGQSVRVTEMMRKIAMRECDRIGYVRLKEAGFNAIWEAGHAD